MIEILLWAAAWYLIGIAIFLRTCWEIAKEIRVKDVLAALFAGVSGPLMVMWWILYGKSDWINKRVL
jgi:hypothetical protein